MLLIKSDELFGDTLSDVDVLTEELLELTFCPEFDEFSVELTLTV